MLLGLAPAAAQDDDYEFVLYGKPSFAGGTLTGRSGLGNMVVTGDAPTILSQGIVLAKTGQFLSVLDVPLTEPLFRILWCSR